MINMRHIESELDKIVYDEYGDELDAKDKEIELLSNDNKALSDNNKALIDDNKALIDDNKALSEINNVYREGFDQLSNIEDLNSPWAKKLLKH